MTSDTETKATLDLLTPIAALDQEILEYIFLLIATDHSIEAKDRAQSIVSFSRVCKHWRGIVLGYPTLWSHIMDYYGSPAHIKNFLQLSEKALLEFGHRKRPVIFAYRGDRGRTDAERVLALALEHVLRLKSFNFCDRTDTDQCWSMIQTKFLSHPAPYVEYLALHISPGADPISLLETALFEDRAPALRTIDLKGCSLRLDHCPRIMENLGELQIKELDKLPDAPDLKQWLHLLSLCPRLEWLVILDSISRSSQPQYDPSPFALNQLKMLYLGASQADCAALLQAVSIPGACGVRVEAKVHSRYEAVNKSLLHVISQRFKPSAHVSERQWTIGCSRPSNSESDIQIGFLNRGWVEYNVGASSCPGWDSPEDGSSTGKVDPLVNISLRFGPDVESHINDFYESLWDTFASTYSSTTRLATYFQLPEAYKITMISPMADRLHLFRKLEILHITDDYHHSHPHFAIRDPVEPGPDTMIFPALLVVELCLGDFIDNPPSQFIDFVRRRKSSGRPIKQIILDRVTLDKRHFKSEIGDAVEHLDMTEAYDTELDSSDDGIW